MLKMAVGSTEELYGELAASDVLVQCAEGIDGQAAQAGLLLAGHDLDLEVFLETVVAAHPSIELIGCTTVAPISSASEYLEGSTTLTLFASDVIDFTAGLGSSVADGVKGAAREAVAAALGKTEKEPALAIVMPTVEGFDPAALSEEMGKVLGSEVPVFGGGAVPDLPVGSPWVGGVQVYGDQVLTDSLPVLLLSGPLQVSVGVAHGWKPVGRKAVVTRSKNEQVYEIDDEPVIDFYRHYLGATSEPALAHPLAILDVNTGRHYLRAPLVWDEEEGAATFLGSVPEGSTVQIAMASTEEILDGTRASVQEALDGFPEDSRPEGALISACAVRGFLLGTRTALEIERIKEGLGPDVPITGFYAYGEFAPLGASNAPKFHNETCVTVLIGTVTDDAAQQDDTAQQSVGDAERQNRTLRKRLARAELKAQRLETLQDQNSHLMRALMADLDAEKAKSEELLLNILPSPIAERLKTGQAVIADRYESVSVLFSDIVGFTPLSENLTPEEMVEWLNEVYSAVDAMVTEHGVEKIRTIGDGYMCAAGVPVPREDHATILTNLALAMKAHFEELAPVHGHKADFRIGINSGPVVGGVIGTLKFQYDIWGDTVNTAARMESHGVPGRVHISPATHALIQDSYVCEPRGPIDIKGKGTMETWFVEAPKRS